MTYRQKEAGQALILMVLGIVVLIGALGLGIDMGYYRYQKRQLQTAADAAALAGAQALPTVANVQPAAYLALGSSYDGYGTSTGTTVAVNTPPTCTTSAPCNLPAADPNTGNPKYVEVMLTQNQPTFFSKIFGVSSVPLTARAEAESNLNCIYTLSQSGTGITVGLSVITTDCGIVDESANTGTPSALECVLGIISAPSTEIVGNYDHPLCSITAKPRTGIALPSKPYDPLSYLASTPPSTTCTANTLTPPAYNGSTTALNFGTGQSQGTAPATIEAGVYCGGITLNSGANVTFTNNPITGSTVIVLVASTTTANALGVGPNTTVNTGLTGVTFYNQQGAINFFFPSASANSIVLSAPTAGSTSSTNFPGMLFIQPKSNTTAATILGTWGFNAKLLGGYYMPSAPLTYLFDFGAETAGEYSPVVVNSLQLYVSITASAHVSIFNHPPSGVNPLRNQSALLVE